jgi:hypothetical protein
MAMNRYPNNGNPFAQDLNGDGLITEADYAIAARQMGWGPLGEKMARDAFRHHDKDKNRVLDPREVYLSSGGNYGGGNGFQPSPRNPLMRDYNGDGLITEADYAIGARQLGWGPVGEKMARDSFRHHDRDRNGVLDWREAMNAEYGYY